MVPVLVQDDILKEKMSREGQDWQRPQKGEEGVCCIQLGKLSAFSISQRKRKGAYVGSAKLSDCSVAGMRSDEARF